VGLVALEIHEPLARQRQTRGSLRYVALPDAPARRCRNAGDLARHRANFATAQAEVSQRTLVQAGKYLFGAPRCQVAQGTPHCVAAQCVDEGRNSRAEQGHGGMAAELDDLLHGVLRGGESVQGSFDEP
jgi:hypothetical protein